MRMWKKDKCQGEQGFPRGLSSWKVQGCHPGLPYTLHPGCPFSALLPSGLQGLLGRGEPGGGELWFAEEMVSPL